MDPGELYAAGRQRVCELVGGLSENEAATPVPACPAWTVRDVLAHLAGVSADIVTGNLEGVTTEPWTQAQVDARRGASIAALDWSTDPAPYVPASTFGPFRPAQEDIHE